MKTILLTGGSGFIGRSILNSELAKTYKILAPTHAELDLLDERAVGAYLVIHRPTFVIHTATLGDVPEAIEKNTRMFLNLARMEDFFGRMFNLSSGAVYDRTKYLNDVREEDIGETIPTDPYGYSKFLMERMGNTYTKIVTLYLFGIYGPMEQSFRFPIHSITKALRGESPIIYQERMMSYLWIGDFLYMLNQLMRIPLDAVLERGYNLTPDNPIRLSEFGNRIVETISPNKANEALVVTKELAPSYTGSNSKLKKLFRDYGLDWWMWTPLCDAIQQMADEIRGRQ